MKVPYPLTAAMKVDDRNAQMATAISIANARGYARLAQAPINERQTLALACYGPSLVDTWELLRDQQAAGAKILSMSGATHFLAERGVVADYHVDMDPRAHKVGHLKPLVPGVHYLMASVCPPETWELLKDYPPELITLWHTFSGVDSTGVDTYGWVAANDKPGELVIHGGSTIGLTALHIGGVLGYRHFEIHGMDGSRRSGGQRHAGIHYGKPQNDPITWSAEGVKYDTSQIMANAVAETINTCKRFPVFAIFHGDGLTQALIREAHLPNACTANQMASAQRIRAAYARMVDMPAAPAKTTATYWDALIDCVPKDAVTELIKFIKQAEPLRAHARYNTGSISLETMLMLRAACFYYKPKIIIEIGTFIGCSTYALEASERLYTCDLSNDCLVATDNVIPHPFTTSTQLLSKLVSDGACGDVDLFFFDGRLLAEDVPLIQHLSHPRTIYLFDDCVDKQKGIANLKLLAPALPDHGAISPNVSFAGRSTLGALIPLLS